MPKIDHTPSDDASLKRGFAECSLPTQLPSVSPSDVLNASKTMPSRAARLKVQDLQPRLKDNDGEYKHDSGFTNTYADVK